MLKLFIYDEGWAGGWSVIAKNKDDAARLIIMSEDIPPHNPEEYKEEIKKYLRELPLTEGSVYHFLGDQ